MVFWLCYRIFRFLCRSVGKEKTATYVVLYYHNVPSSQRKRFGRQMDILIKLARPIKLDKVGFLEKGAHHAAVTFDDGFQSFVENAMPELVIRNIPTTIFIPTGYIGESPNWYTEPGYNIAHERILQEKQIRELPSDLITVGSHSITHSKLTLLEEREAKKELLESRAKLESISGRSVTLFSFPYGDYNNNLLVMAREAGYKKVFVSLPKIESAGWNGYVIGRVSVSASDWQLEFILKLFGAYSWLPIASSLKRKLFSRDQVKILMKISMEIIRKLEILINIKDMENKKKLLVINYYFPPIGGAGVKRSLKFIKFLPMNGWDPIVLTVKNGNHHLIDNSLLKEIRADLSVYRAFSFENIFNKGIGVTSKTNGALVKDNSIKNLFRGDWLKRCYKYFGRFIQIPDSRILWLPGAVATGMRLTIGRKFDAIYATGPTFASLLVGALLKSISGKPLVIDFRDAWVSDPTVQYEKKYLQKINASMEKLVIKAADRVISTNPFVTDDFKKRYSEVNQSKFDTIYNGFDMEDYNMMKGFRSKKDYKFRIVHTGRLYGERTPRFFLEAIRDTLEGKPEMRRKFEVIFVGPCETFLDGKRIENYLEELDLKDVVKLTGQISRRESLEYLMLGHLLLLVVGIVPKDNGLTYGIPGKLFDYLVAEKPILTLANGGSTRNFLVTNGIGSIYYHEDIQGVKEYLIGCFERFERGIDQNEYDIKIYEQFDYRALTRQFVEHLNDICKNKE